MKNKAIGFLAIPTMALLSSFNFANADDTSTIKTHKPNTVKKVVSTEAQV